VAIAGLSDGTYPVGAQAQNASGVLGPTVSMSVVLSRSVPSAPVLTYFGFNPSLFAGGTQQTAAELQWQPNPELNVIGYRVYNPSGSLICTTQATTANASCGSSAWCMTETACIDLTPPSPTASNLSYTVAALYKDASGNTQQGPTTPAPLTGANVDTYVFAPSTGNGGTNCPASPEADMLGNYAGGANTSTQAGGTITFCSPGATAGTTFGSGGTATVYLTNTSNSACTVNASLSVDGTTSMSTASLSVPGSTGTPVPFGFNLAGTGSTTLGAGDQLNLAFALGAGSCVLSWGGSSTPSQFRSSAETIQAPNPSVSLSISGGTSGSATLTWSVPSSPVRSPPTASIAAAPTTTRTASTTSTRAPAAPSASTPTPIAAPAPTPITSPRSAATQPVRTWRNRTRRGR